MALTMSTKKSKDRCKKEVQNRQNIQHQVSFNCTRFKSPTRRELEFSDMTTQTSRCNFDLLVKVKVV